LTAQTKNDLNIEFEPDIYIGIKKLITLVNETFEVTLQNLQRNPKDVDLLYITELEDLVNQERDKLRTIHHENITKTEKSMESGLLLRSIYTSFEKIADHIYSINELIIDSK
jgi:Na+/phosphate symporter